MIGNGEQAKHAWAARALLLASVLGGPSACSSEGERTESPAGSVVQPVSAKVMMNWIATIEGQGIRLPGYPANRWIEDWAVARFEELGLNGVEKDPMQAVHWKPLAGSLEVWPAGEPDAAVALDAWPVPLAAEGDAVEGELVLASPADGALAGRIAVTELSLLGTTQARMRDEVAKWSHDPEGAFDTHKQTWPLGPRFQGTIDPEIAAGASAVVGILDFPWETNRYGVPYDARPRSRPAVYLSRSEGRRLKAMMAEGPLQGRMTVRRVQEPVTTYNIVGSLPGASDDWIIIGSHHDGPWHSAVEDASGVALVLAQAEYWARVREAERPHNLLFLLNGGHMSGGAGLRHFVATRGNFLRQKVVAEIHLEHTAREAKVVDGRLVPTEHPEVRWWFTSDIPRLERSVASAICAEQLGRSLIMPVEGFPDPSRKHPPTDGAYFHPLAPIVNFLTAPMYLFDPVDRLEMVHEASLEPVTRATIRIIRDLSGVSAAQMRQERRDRREQLSFDCPADNGARQAAELAPAQAEGANG